MPLHAGRQTAFASAPPAAIGSETIQNARLGILDDASTGIGPGADIILGADFLRAHRVLIAPSQGRLYVSYVGGEVFSK